MAAILFVDNDPLMSKVLGRLLKKDGIDIYHVLSAVEAREVLKSGKSFDTVCSEVLLSAETGIELYDWIRGEKNLFAMPFFFVTALNITSEIGRRMRRDQYCFHFQKPLDPDDFMSVLREMCL